MLEGKRKQREEEEKIYRDNKKVVLATRVVVSLMLREVDDISEILTKPYLFEQPPTEFDVKQCAGYLYSQLDDPDRLFVCKSYREWYKGALS